MTDRGPGRHMLVTSHLWLHVVSSDDYICENLIARPLDSPPCRSQTTNLHPVHLLLACVTGEPANGGHTGDLRPLCGGEYLMAAFGKPSLPMGLPWPVLMHSAKRVQHGPQSQIQEANKM